MAVVGAVGPKPDVAIFADTQSEPAYVYEELDRLEAWGDIPIERPSAGSLKDAIRKGTNSTGQRFASVPFWVDSAGSAGLGRRQCTREYKIDVVKRQIREILGLKKGERAAGRYRVEQWIGISVDEAQRAKPSRDKWIEIRWPLLVDKPMKRAEIKYWLQKNGFPIPKKSACTFCPFRKPIEYARWRRDEPELFEEACEVDDLLRSGGTMRGVKNPQYIWRELKPLREVPSVETLEKSDDSQVELFGNECYGMCGV